VAFSDRLTSRFAVENATMRKPYGRVVAAAPPDTRHDSAYPGEVDPGSPTRICAKTYVITTGRNCPSAQAPKQRPSMIPSSGRRFSEKGHARTWRWSDYALLRGAMHAGLAAIAGRFVRSADAPALARALVATG
jgi:hypothetical protein